MSGSRMDMQVEQCLAMIERRCSTLAAEGYSPGVILSAVSIHFGNMAGIMGAYSVGGPRAFLDELMIRCRANADDQAARAAGGGQGGNDQDGKGHC